MYNFDMNTKTISIQKDSQLISIYASGQLTATQKKIYNSLIFMTKQILKQDSELSVFRIRIHDLLNCMSGDKELHHNHIIDNLKKIKDIRVEYNVLKKNKKQTISVCNLIGGIVIENGMIEYNFDFQILRAIQLPDSYAYLDLKIIKGLNSKYSIGLYEILKDYKKLKMIDIELDKFKKSMDIEENGYPRFNTFRDKVLTPAIEEINSKTDLEIDYDKITHGRKVVGLRFSIRDNKNYDKSLRDKITVTETKPISESVTKDYQYYLNKKLTSKEYKIIGKIRKEYQDKPFFRPFLMHGLVPNAPRYYPSSKFYMKNNLIVNENGEPISDDGFGMTVNAINCFLADHEHLLGDLEPKVEDYVGFNTDVKLADMNSMSGDYEKVEFKIKNVEVKEDHKIVIFENEENKFGIKVPDDKEFIKVYEESKFMIDMRRLIKVEKEPESEEVKKKEYTKRLLNMV
jgi:plasmid replication initiation protein